MQNLPNYKLEASDDENMIFETSLVSNPATKYKFFMFSDETSSVKHQFKAFEIANENDDIEYMISGVWFEPDTKYIRKEEIAPNTYTEYTVEVSREDLQKMIINNKKQGFNDSFMLEHRQSLSNDFVEVESWIYTKDNPKSPLYGHTLEDLGYDASKIKEGTVLKTVFVGDKQFWDDYIVTGKIIGFSIGGRFKQKLETFNATETIVPTIENEIKSTEEIENVDVQTNKETVETVSIEENTTTNEETDQSVDNIAKDEIKLTELQSYQQKQEVLESQLNEMRNKIDELFNKLSEKDNEVNKIKEEKEKLSSKLKDEEELSALLSEQAKNSLTLPKSNGKTSSQLNNVGNTNLGKEGSYIPLSQRNGR